MNSLKNKVQLIGHLGAAPEVKTVANGTTLAKLRIATTDTYRNATGETVKDTQWHNVVLWGKTAEIAGKYLNKGSEVMIEGRLTYREYVAQDGTKRHITEIVGNELMMMDKKPLMEGAAS